jgi:predicted Rossmann fold flavoprotein
LNYDYNLLVIGGGAAGFFSALSAAESAPNMKIGLLEKSGKLLSKVRISGGGRCNVTNAQDQIKNFSKSYPRGEKFMYKLLHQFNQQNTIEWFIDRGVKLHAEPDGRMFPVSNDSSSIVDCLMQEAEKAKKLLDKEAEKAKKLAEKKPVEKKPVEKKPAAKKEKKVEEEVESNTFGTFIHEVLEDLYQPFSRRDSVGELKMPQPPSLQPEDIDKMLKGHVLLQ